MRAALAVIATAAAAACVAERPEESVGTPAGTTKPLVRMTMVYECEAGFAFVAAVRNDTAWVFLPTETLNLPHVPAASGVRYSNGTATLWTHGEEALLDTPEDSVRGCVNNRAKAIWEHAKLGGVDFRAVGNEPGWHMEISPDSVRLMTDYGRERYAFPTPPVEESRPDRRSVYRASVEGHVIEVQLEGRDCRDSMSGEAFETNVTVILDGRVLRGCGRPLH